MRLRRPPAHSSRELDRAAPAFRVGGVTVAPPDYDELVEQTSDELEHSSGFRTARVALAILGAVGGALLGVVVAHGPVGLAGVVPGALVGFLATWIYAAIRARQIATQRFFAAWA